MDNASRVRGYSRTAVAVIVASAFALAPAPAQAIFSGAPGQITFNSDRQCPTSSNENPSPQNPSQQRCGGEIYSMNADGSGLHSLTNNPYEDKYPAWSPNGREIVFQSQRNCREMTGVTRTCVNEIFKMNADGSNQTRLTMATGFTDQFPSWSPDGKEIIFTRTPVSEFGQQTYVMNSDGSNQHQLLDADGLDVTPNSQQITSTRQTGGYTIAVSRISSTAFPAGSNAPDDFINGIINECFVSSSVSAQQSQCDIPPYDSQIFTVQSDGTGMNGPLPTQKQAFSFDTLPAYSPAGTTATAAGRSLRAGGGKIVFVSARQCDFQPPGPPGPPPVQNCGLEIWVMNADGSNPKRLTFSFKPGCGDQCVQNLKPDWSPDGTKILFYRLDPAHGEDKHAELYEMNADGSGVTRLTNVARGANRANSENASWQPTAGLVTTASAPSCSRTGRVRFTVSDPTGFVSQPTALHYRVSGGKEHTAALSGNAVVLTVKRKKKATIEYWGQNQQGDLERTHRKVTVRVDRKKPRIRIRSLQHRRTYRVGQRASIRITVKDDTKLRRNPAKRRLRISTRRAGVFRIRRSARDSCGNRASASFRYRVLGRRTRPQFTG